MIEAGLLFAVAEYSGIDDGRCEAVLVDAVDQFDQAFVFAPAGATQGLEVVE